MAVFNGMLPILPGQEEAARAWAQEIAGARREGFAAMNARGDVTRETWTFVTTPIGCFILFWFEGDVAEIFDDVVAAQDDFAVWFRARLKAITGLDLST